MATLDRIALLFDADVYAGKPRPTERNGTGIPGLVPDRQIAGRAFLKGLLAHGQIPELVLVVRDRANLQAAKALLQEQPPRSGKQVRIVFESEFAAVRVPMCHLPGVIDPSLPWARTTGARWHGLTGWIAAPPAAPGVAQTLQLLALAPTETCDALICASEAIRATVGTLLAEWTGYLHDRFGGELGARLRLEVIPPCLEVAREKPDRSEERAAVGIGPDEVAVLCVSPLSLHLRASPFPLVQALSEAARAAGKLVHLLLAGPADHELILEAVADCARIIGANLKASIVDPVAQPGVWQAADLFAVGGDSPHDSATVPILQALAHGLPVVAADWAGARELVVEGETGFLIPTALVRDATGDATTRLILGETDYDPFLAEVTQTVVVDLARFREGLRRLIEDAGLRREMGEAARQFVALRHSPNWIVQRYEALWSELAAARSSRTTAAVGPAVYPVPEHLFAGLATEVLNGATRVQLVAGCAPRVYKLQTTPATSFAALGRCGDLAVLRVILAAAYEPVTITALDALFAQVGQSRAAGRGTIAWLLKYGVLRVFNPTDGSPAPVGLSVTGRSAGDERKPI
jgi:glycosyltransferase involved in cell wall biosynthesis